MSSIAALLKSKTKLHDLMHQSQKYAQYNQWFQASLPEPLAMCCQVVRVVDGQMVVQVFHAGLMTWCRFSTDLLLANFQKAHPRSKVTSLVWQCRPMKAHVGTQGQSPHVDSPTSDPRTVKQTPPQPKFKGLSASMGSTRARDALDIAQQRRQARAPLKSLDVKANKTGQSHPVKSKAALLHGKATLRLPKSTHPTSLRAGVSPTSPSGQHTLNQQPAQAVLDDSAQKLMVLTNRALKLSRADSDHQTQAHEGSSMAGHCMMSEKKQQKQPLQSYLKTSSPKHREGMLSLPSLSNKRPIPTTTISDHLDQDGCKASKKTPLKKLRDHVVTKQVFNKQEASPLPADQD